MRHRQPEHFTITKLARRYDRQTGTFTINITYQTAPPKPTKRVTAIAESFGLGLDKTQKFTIYNNLQLQIKPSDIVYITGDSGSGKSILLKALEKDIKQNTQTTVINIEDITPDTNKPLIETTGKTLQQALELLSKTGLNDAFLFLRTYNQLSDGQKYRYKIAKMIENQAQHWIMDEFAATLDRDTAKIVAYNLQKLARQQHKTVLAATTHTDLLQDLNPSVHIHKRYGKEITIRYYPNEQAAECSLIKEMRIEEGTTEDWRRLADFHYRNHRITSPRKIFTLKRGEELCGVIVYSYPPPACFGRKQVLPRMTMKELNEHLSTISRVVVHPKYRTISLGAKLVKDTLPLAGTRYVEMIAVMAKYNPFAEKAGMRRIAESTPSRHASNSIARLRSLGFNTTLLSSHSVNMQTLRRMADKEIEGVKTIMIDLCKHERAYGRRLLKTKNVFCEPQEAEEAISKASLRKLAEMLRVLSILVQPKVYLFWEKPV